VIFVPGVAAAPAPGKNDHKVRSIMSKPFVWQELLVQSNDTTEYELLSTQHVTVTELEGEEVIKVAPEALTLLAQQAFYEASFFLRAGHLTQIASILHDPQASSNDKYVALQLLRNAEVSAKGVLPNCQDTGTATVVASKGQHVWTGGDDAEALSKGVYATFSECNLRYSQTHRWTCIPRSTPKPTCRRR
jgi:fumarate hydratase class I